MYETGYSYRYDWEYQRNRQMQETKIIHKTPESPESVGSLTLLLAGGAVGSPAETTAYLAAVPVEVTTGLATATYVGDSLQRKTGCA